MTSEFAVVRSEWVEAVVMTGPAEAVAAAEPQVRWAAVRAGILLGAGVGVLLAFATTLGAGLPVFLANVADMGLALGALGGLIAAGASVE